MKIYIYMILIYTFTSSHIFHPSFYCEAKGKGRAKGPLREVNQLSFIDYRLSIINVDFPEALH